VINFVGEGRSHLCMRFASKDEDKFSGVEWRPTATGLPLLAGDALAWAECAIVHDVEIGDHALLVARVEDGGVQPELEPPLLYYRRSWGVWSPTHDPAEPEPEAVAPSIEVGARDVRWQGAEM